MPAPPCRNSAGLRAAVCGLVAALSVGLPSCRYHFGHGELAEQYRTLSIPYAQGDESGGLTAAVVREMSVAGLFRYAPADGELILTIKLLDRHESNIDFRYDRDNRGKRKNSIIPTATRLKVTAEIALIEAATGKMVRGPAVIEASAEFDHTYYTTRHQINIFSLGQLTDIDAAREAAIDPLNRSLAAHIVDHMINNW